MSVEVRLGNVRTDEGWEPALVFSSGPDQSLPPLLLSSVLENPTFVYGVPIWLNGGLAVVVRKLGGDRVFSVTVADQAIRIAPGLDGACCRVLLIAPSDCQPKGRGGKKKAVGEPAASSDEGGTSVTAEDATGKAVVVPGLWERIFRKKPASDGESEVC